MPKKLDKSILKAVRGRLGVDDNDNDTSRDAEILKMEPREIVKLYCGWILGYEAWGDTFIDVVEQAYGLGLLDKRKRNA